MTTIAKALKEKNKLKLEISLLLKRMNTHNSVMKGNSRPFDLSKLDQELPEKISAIISLKSAITNANQPVQEKIYRMAELKALIAFYKKLNVTEGKSTEGYGSEVHEFDVFFNEAVIYEKVKKLEADVEIIQDELEAFNHVTII